MDDILQDLVQFAKGRVTQQRGWIFAVARTAIADHNRGKRPTVELPPSLAFACPDPRAGSTKEMGACLKPMIDALPEKMRASLVMADCEGTRQREVAGRLGISLNGVPGSRRWRTIVRRAFGQAWLPEHNTGAARIPHAFGVGSQDNLDCVAGLEV